MASASMPQMATIASAMMTIAWPAPRRRILMSISILRPHRRPGLQDEGGTGQVRDHGRHRGKPVGDAHGDLWISRGAVRRDPDVARVGGAHWGDRWKRARDRVGQARV